MWSTPLRGMLVGRAFTLSPDSPARGADPEPATASPTKGALGPSSDLDAEDNLGGGDSAVAACLREECIPAAWRGWSPRVPVRPCSRRCGPSAGESLVPAAPCPSRASAICSVGLGATCGAWTSRPLGPSHTLTRGNWRASSPWVRRGFEITSGCQELLSSHVIVLAPAGSVVSGRWALSTGPEPGPPGGLPPETEAQSPPRKRESEHSRQTDFMQCLFQGRYIFLM